jgi:hypothetical protein
VLVITYNRIMYTPHLQITDLLAYTDLPVRCNFNVRVVNLRRPFCQPRSPQVVNIAKMTSRLIFYCSALISTYLGIHIQQEMLLVNRDNV